VVSPDGSGFELDLTDIIPVGSIHNGMISAGIDTSFGVGVTGHVEVQATFQIVPTSGEQEDDPVRVSFAPVPDGTGAFSWSVSGLALGPDLVANADIGDLFSVDVQGSMNNDAALAGGVVYIDLFPGTTTTVPPATTSTTMAIPAATPLAGIDTETLTATVTNQGPGTPTGTVAFFDTTAGIDLGSTAVVNGVASLNAGTFTAGTHTITATYSGDSNFQSSSSTATLTALTPASLSGTVFADFNQDGQIDFGEKGISGVSVQLTGTDDLGHAVNQIVQTDGDGAYLFLNLRPGSYDITKTTQPAGFTPGIDTVGTAGVSLSSTVADQFFVTLAQGVNGMNYNYAEVPAATGAVHSGQTAAVGFWNNKNGQALINAFNGGGTSTQLGDWLAATFVNMYGANSANDLAGKNNAYIANLFHQDFLQKGQKLDASVLATALSVYATDATLDSTGVAGQYGFTVSGNGVGTATFNVSSDGAAFGVVNNTSLTVMDLLLATDDQAVNGLLYGGNTTLRTEANAIFSALNQAGNI
jgi:hypothetical protein